ncbi:MAG: ankyrin repeat domain-containing protein [Armatimonadota bacterium]
MNRILALPVLIFWFIFISTAQSAPIHDAVIKGDTTKVSSLLKANQSVSNTCDKSGATPLHYASSSGRIDLIKLLIGKGANIDARKPDGVAPLHIAASAGRLEAVQFLIDSKADVNAVDLAGRTPLSISMEKQNVDVIKILLSHSAKCGKPSSVANASASVVFPKSHVPSKTLFHANLLQSPMDIRLALTILQGLVNREQPRIYITQDPGWHTPDLIPKWMDGLRSRGYLFVDVEKPLDLVTFFRRNVKGAVLYESDIEANTAALHKLNAITLYCSLNDAIPVTPELNTKLKLPVLLDTRGLLNSPKEAYEWAYRELWPRANHNLLAHTCPTHIVLRDYLVENRIMPFWISKDMDASDEALCMRFLDEAKPNTPVMGCWGGYGEIPTGRIDEGSLERIVCERGKFMVVTDGCFNLSIHSGLSYKHTKTERPARYPVYDSSKIYLCFNYTDGDNLQWIQQIFCGATWWGNPRRGQIPTSWTVNPSSADLIPDVLEYLESTQSPNDEIVCSTQGVGIISAPIYAKRCSNPETVCNEYLALTRQAMVKTGMSMIHLGDTSGVPWTQSNFDAFASGIPELTGILAEYNVISGVTAENATFMAAGRVPTVRVLCAPFSDQSGDKLAAAIRNAAPKQRPAFMHVSLINWFNNPSVVIDALGKLGYEYVPVTPSDFFYLMTMPISTKLWYDFTDSAEGWGNANDIGDMEVKDGVVTGTATGGDPYLIRGNMRVNAEGVSKVVVRVKAGAGGGGVKFYFVTDSSPVWDEAKSARTENVGADGNWHEYTLPIGQNQNWKGIVTGIRINPTCLKANIPFSVDYIRGE